MLMKNLLKILFVIPFIYMLILPVFTYSLTTSKPCGGIEININDSSDYHFVTKRQLMNLAYGNSGRILGKPVKAV